MKKSTRRLVTALLCLCLCLTLSALFPRKASADQVISKVLTTTKYTPVALMDLDLVPAGTSTSGVYIASYYWFDVDTGYIITGQFGEGVYRVEITLNTYDGFVFDDVVAAYLNNIPIDYVMSEDHRSLTVYRTYAAEIWAPSVVKQPSDETVNAGGIASFSATAIYTVGYQWHAFDPATRQDYAVTDLPYIFSGVTLNPEGKSTLTIENVPAEMDGWHIYCTFLGASFAKSNSNYALLRVRHPEPLPTPEPLPVTEEETVPEPTAEPEPESAEESVAEPAPGIETEISEHVHEFPDTWTWDAEMHWRECSCGERIEQGAHEIQWSVKKRATKTEPGLESGICSVCGYEGERSLPYTGMSQWLRVTLIGVGGLAVLTGLVLLADSARRRAKSRRGAANKPAGYSGRHVKK